MRKPLVLCVSECSLEDDQRRWEDGLEVGTKLYGSVIGF